MKNKLLSILALIAMIACKKESQETKFDFVSSCSDCQTEVVKYPNGQIEWEYQIKNGKKHGLARGWWPSGKISSEKYYKDGNMHGPQKSWDENGNQIGSSMWQNGKIVE